MPSKENGASHVSTSMYFLASNELFKSEKPYAFRFTLAEHGLPSSIPQTNMKMERRDDIIIDDIRGNEKMYTLEKNGFEVITHTSQIAYEDYYEPEKVKSYLQELEEVLKDRLKASHVQVFRYGLRKRHSEFPVSTGEAYEYDQPTSVAHVDTTPEELSKEITRQYGEEANSWLTKRCQWINIWKPLKGPLTDWPLAVCNAAVVDKVNDLEAADLLYPDLATENYQVYYNPNHEWHYLSGQEVSELMVFKQADHMMQSSLPGVPHCSFPNPFTPKGEAPRESIEARALVFYDD
ncbi:CmcJ-like methyltransferase, putative [Talaromyces stipitatus ATCC 10500]|uniref:CmcJ-like methyltransferase, putative n=1 Tax=Talaromyces stipitatus (strain ATCC 10500 / CBS 375.48 / QM 6759 / NRRL 1006) TaxID=441959 RepID=B8ME92_TALSN|nr:CmcJ-like methyltransferase, putative [Talaromyces stipitatus ATCC 10500]EED16519.1 CmcJ-like methyltransferase, putative [Talaromyces stipitatus ATCC 10500]